MTKEDAERIVSHCRMLGIAARLLGEHTIEGEQSEYHITINGFWYKYVYDALKYLEKNYDEKPS